MESEPWQSKRLGPLAAAVVASGVAVAMLLQGCDGYGKNDTYQENDTQGVCPTTCPASRSSGDKNTGFTENTGFNNTDGKQCCDICALKGQAINSNSTYDWDYLILDSLDVPHFCQALQEGHDITLTHPSGTRCPLKAKQEARLSIHGLWPDWFNNYAACCLQPSPLHTDVVKDWSFAKELGRHWSDAAMAVECSACFNLNHEWQKHGRCFTDSAEAYFRVGLALQQAMAHATDAVSTALDQRQGASMTVSELISVWNASFQARGQQPPAVNVICDPQGPGLKVDGTVLHFFSELQVCWGRAPGVKKGIPLYSLDHLVPIDCPSAQPRHMTAPCPEHFAVSGDSVVNEHWSTDVPAAAWVASRSTQVV